MTVTYTRDFLTGVAELLDGAGVGVWSPSAPVPDGATAITIKRQGDQPDRCVTLTPYVPRATEGRDLTVLGVQAICRGLPGDPLDVDDLADAVYNALHELTDEQIGYASVGISWRASHGHLDVDANGRYRTTSNFYFATSQPASQSAE